MVREFQGVEIFGRGATVIDTASREEVPRTAALGAASIALAVLAAIAFAAAVVERSLGDDAFVLFTWIALVGSAFAVAAGVAALLTGRGRVAGLVGALAGAAANPWLLGLVLEYLAALPTS